MTLSREAQEPRQTAQRLRSTRIKVGLSLASIASTLVLVEIVLRLFYPVGAVVYRFNDRYFQEYRPYARKIFRRLPVNGGDRVEVDINSYGFRGDEFEIPKPLAVNRIIVYGDSYVAAEYTALRNTFPAVLEMRLAAVSAVEVLNAGIVGFGPDQVARRLPSDLSRLEPDLVLVMISAHNDLGDLIRNRIFRLDRHGALVDNRYEVDDALRQEFQQTILSQLALNGLLRAGWRGLTERLARDVESTPIASAQPSRLERELRVVQAEFEQFVIQGDTKVETVFVDRYDADVSLLPTSRSAVYKIGLLRATLDRLRSLVDAAGARLLVVVIPSPFVFDGYDEIRVDRARFPRYTPSGSSDAIASADQGPTLDLFQTFAGSDPTSLYFRQDTHWNDRGQALAAAVVARRIVSEGLLP